MQDELFRDGAAFITNEVFQVADRFITVDDVKSYALEKDKDTSLRQIRADPSTTRQVFLIVAVAFAMCLAVLPGLLKGEVRFGDREFGFTVSIILFFMGSLAFLFWPRKPKFCLSVVDREVRPLRYKSSNQQNVLNAFNALEKAIDQHYAKYPQAERPRMIKGTF
jgi:hypothetical protein